MNYLEKKQIVDSTTLTQQDLVIQNLRGQLKNFEIREEDWLTESNKQQEEIFSLKQQINELESSISMRIVELDNKNQSIKILERQMLDMKEKVNNFECRNFHQCTGHLAMVLVDNCIS